MNNFQKSSIFNFIKHHKYFLFLVAILSCMSLVLYREYIFGGKLFLFEDFGSDSVRVSLPTYIYFFDWFKNGMPLWSDKMGIGTSVLSHGDIIFDPFTYILFIFGKNGIIYMFVYMVIAKIIFSGIFFWMFLGKYKLSSLAKMIGVITYAFGGYMIVVGQNYVFGTIYAYMPLIFLGFEIWLQDRKKWLLIIMLTFTALYFFYFFYMTAIFFAVYAIFRYFTIYSYKRIHFLKYIFSLACYGIIAMGLSAFYWMPSLALTLNNLRIGLPLTSVGNMFILNSSMVLTTVSRLFGYDTLGTPTIYTGYVEDYFQLALFCGIITIVLVPQIFIIIDKTKKRAYGIFFISMSVLLFVPFFSYVFNGFSDFTYRWIYVIHFFLALLLATVVDLVYEKMRINFKVLFITIGMLFIISLIIIDSISPLRESVVVNLRIFLKDYILIVSYLMLTILFFRTRYKKVIKTIILVLVCIELVWFPWRFINDRLTTSPDPVKNQLGYYDNTNKAVSYLNQIDNTIYRIDKSYDSVVSEYGNTPSDNDAMAQGYRGLKSYNGNNQPNYIRFLQDAGIFVKYPTYVPLKGVKPQDLKGQQLNYINGVGNRYLLQSFLGVKYYLAKNDVELPVYYQYVTKIDNINIYKNDNYLPLGFTFDSFITQDEFLKLNNFEKDLALLSFVVTDNKNELSDVISKNNTSVLNNIVSDTDISDVILKRRRNYLKIISYKEDHIVGQISDSKNKILVLTVPYDQGWIVSVDNHKVTPFKVDNGLIGIKLNSGPHVIELRYFPPKLKLGIIISIITLLLIFLFMRYKKIILKQASVINNQSMQFYNNHARNSYVKLTKLLLKKISVITGRFGLSIKKYIFYITSLFGILMFIFSGFITRGHSFYNLFQFNKLDYFMDFYKPLSELFNGPYASGSIYPPLPQLLYRLILRFIPYDIAAQGPFVIRASQAGQIVFLLYMLITLLIFLILLMEVKKGLRIEKYIFTFVILLSAPFLFQFERANIVFIALLFLMIFVFFKDSKNRIVREIAIISLAVSIGIKLYPVVFILLLFKENRFKDAFKVFIYSVGFFILPFFAIGGIGQLPILVKNILSTSSGTMSWGVGYTVNIQNMIRIFFGFFGDFGNSPILIGRVLSFAVLVLGFVSAFFLRTKWKTIALISLLMIVIPSISFEYVLIFMVIPLIMFLDREEKEKWDYFYLICFILIFIPFTLSKLDALNYQFGEFARPLTYGLLIQNIAISIMTVSLIVQGLILKPKNLVKSTKKFVLAVILKISKKIVTILKSITTQLSRFDKFYWLIPVFVILIYNLIFFNRFYPITEGWFSTYAWLFNHGQFPYRDFYFFLTPFYLVIISIFTAIFGYDILSLRILGLGVILLMTYFLYKNFEIIFKAPIAAFVVIIGMIYYQSNNAHITYDFTQFLTLFGLIQSYFLLRYVSASGPETNAGIKWVFTAGLFAGLAFLTKQSNGAMIAAFSFAGLLLLSLPKGKQDILRVLLSYILGFAAPLIITILWLLTNSAFFQFFGQILSDAVGAKGGMAQIFFSWSKGILTYNFAVRLREILLIVLVFGYWIYFFTGKSRKNENINKIFMLVASFSMLLVVLLPLFINITAVNKLSNLGQIGINNVIVAAISIPIISISIAVLFFILKKPFNKSIFLFSFVALGFIYGTGTSAGITEVGAFAGFCLFIALMLHYRSILGLGKVFIVLFCISFSFVLVEAKYEQPYYWWNVTSPDVRVKLWSTDKIKMLHGIYTSSENIKLIEEVSAEIRTGTKPGESVLLFPNIPVFYLFTDRKPPGKAVVYWFDFLPDQMAIKEAELIRKKPPKVIVYLDLGPLVWEAHERLFRDGKPSGQRKINDAIMEIIKSGKMHISKQYELAKGVLLTVWRE